MDRDTIARAAEGDHDALEQIFERNMGPLVAFVRMKAGGVVAARESAVDIAQSVCREVLQDLDDFEFRGEVAFRNFLFLQATRKILNRHRHHHQARRDVAREAAQPRTSAAQDNTLLASYATVSTPTRAASTREEIERIEAAILTLPDDQREAIMMSRVMDLDYDVIATEMGKSESAVRGLVARGLAALASKLGQ